ncbi:hypothetical protein [Aureimonas sp. Leaf460]|uniref:hypothetical protein n=2 Tax=unclassified Aureimonas TaxID=2615206 RepID=UPI001AEBF23B|nr:hypothetical protein [Aureimonas sp. Leaf460]
MRSMKRAVLVTLGLAAGLLSLAGAASAEEAAEAVRALYAPVWNPLEGEDLSKLTGPALALFEKSAKVSAETGEAGCVDFVVTVGGQDFDDEEVARTIETVETGRSPEGDALVTARFRSFPDGDADQEIRWTMRQVGGAWKVADIESPLDEWKLSTFPCD